MGKEGQKGRQDQSDDFKGVGKSGQKGRQGQPDDFKGVGELGKKGRQDQPHDFKGAGKLGKKGRQDQPADSHYANTWSTSLYTHPDQAWQCDRRLSHVAGKLEEPTSKDQQATSL